MRFGIFYEFQLPKPWGERDEYNLYKEGLAQIELADKLGYDYAWEVEHHFLEEYSHSSAPEVFLAAASQRTPSPPLPLLDGSAGRSGSDSPAGRPANRPNSAEGSCSATRSIAGASGGGRSVCRKRARTPAAASSS